MAKNKPKNNGLKAKIIGCGGIGTCLTDTLCRYLQFSDHPNIEVSLIDGDTYEERNRERQVFKQLGPKASVTAERLRDEFPRLIFWDHPVYLADHNIISLIRENDFVFSCVDNHKTRKLVSERAEELDNVTIISGGNDYEDGNVQIHIRRDGQNITVPVASHYHPEIQNPQDRNPGDVDEEREGCQELAAAAPQLLIMNNLIAAHMLKAFYAVLKGYHEKDPKEYSEFYLDIPSGKVVPRTRFLPKK
jgi:molybdopterin/thiamine biosynthesis adenylyltransferase